MEGGNEVAVAEHLRFVPFKALKAAESNPFDPSLLQSLQPLAVCNKFGLVFIAVKEVLLISKCQAIESLARESIKEETSPDIPILNQVSFEEPISRITISKDGDSLFVVTPKNVRGFPVSLLASCQGKPPPPNFEVDFEPSILKFSVSRRSDSCEGWFLAVTEDYILRAFDAKGQQQCEFTGVHSGCWAPDGAPLTAVFVSGCKLDFIDASFKTVFSATPPKSSWEPKDASNVTGNRLDWSIQDCLIVGFCAIPPSEEESCLFLFNPSSKDWSENFGETCASQMWDNAPSFYTATVPEWDCFAVANSQSPEIKLFERKKGEDTFAMPALEDRHCLNCPDAVSEDNEFGEPTAALAMEWMLTSTDAVKGEGPEPPLPPSPVLLVLTSDMVLVVAAFVNKSMPEKRPFLAAPSDVSAVVEECATATSESKAATSSAFSFGSPSFSMPATSTASTESKVATGGAFSFGNMALPSITVPATSTATSLTKAATSSAFSFGSPSFSMPATSTASTESKVATGGAFSFGNMALPSITAPATSTASTETKAATSSAFSFGSPTTTSKLAPTRAPEDALKLSGGKRKKTPSMRRMKEPSATSPPANAQQKAPADSNDPIVKELWNQNAGMLAELKKLETSGVQLLSASTREESVTGMAGIHFDKFLEEISTLLRQSRRTRQQFGELKSQSKLFHDRFKQVAEECEHTFDEERCMRTRHQPLSAQLRKRQSAIRERVEILEADIPKCQEILSDVQEAAKAGKLGEETVSRELAIQDEQFQSLKKASLLLADQQQDIAQAQHALNQLLKGANVRFPAALHAVEDESTLQSESRFSSIVEEMGELGLVTHRRFDTSEPDLPLSDSGDNVDDEDEDNGEESSDGFEGRRPLAESTIFPSWREDTHAPEEQAQEIARYDDMRALFQRWNTHGVVRCRHVYELPRPVERVELLSPLNAAVATASSLRHASKPCGLEKPVVQPKPQEHKAIESAAPQSGVRETIGFNLQSIKPALSPEPLVPAPDVPKTVVPMLSKNPFPNVSAPETVEPPEPEEDANGRPLRGRAKKKRLFSDEPAEGAFKLDGLTAVSSAFALSSQTSFSLATPESATSTAPSFTAPAESKTEAGGAFSFGISGATSSTATTETKADTLSFGTSAARSFALPATSTTTATPATGFSFGAATSTATTETKADTLSFGTTAAPSFGSPATSSTTATGAGFSFGNLPATTTAGFSFGGTPGPTFSSSATTFGGATSFGVQSTTPATTAPSSTVFGSSSSGFGATAFGGTTTTPGFGLTTAPTTAGGGAGGFDAALLQFYQAMNPSKVSTVPTIREKYRGKEMALVTQLLKKYPTATELISKMHQTLNPQQPAPSFGGTSFGQPAGPTFGASTQFGSPATAAPTVFGGSAPGPSFGSPPQQQPTFGGSTFGQQQQPGTTSGFASGGFGQTAFGSPPGGTAFGFGGGDFGQMRK